MHNSVFRRLVITTGSDADSETMALAKQNAEHWGIEYLPKAEQGLVLLQKESRLELRQLDEPKVGAVFVDFASDAMTFRRLHGGGKKEAIAKAVGLKGKDTLYVLDATAGLGKDAFVLASLGCQVDMIERSPVVAALLDDGLRRGAMDPELREWLPKRMQLFHGIAHELLNNWLDQPRPNAARPIAARPIAARPDIIYLDPMFPHRRKKAAVKKDMRLFQQLLGPDEDSDLMLEPALALAKKRVVVKRPSGAPFLDERKPQIEMQGKANRFDIYIVNNTKQ